MSYKIPFNKPYLSGNELGYIHDAVQSGKISGDGIFTRRCQQLLEERYGFRKCLLTTSCTDALEMAAILVDIKPGDEVIVPSYTFVSTANAFILRGANVIFADSEAATPNMDVELLEQLITPRTKAIIPVHYAGIACDMERIMALATRHNIYVIEDAAQAIDSYYLDSPLGSVGHLAAFSFHETKNIQCGEGGMLVINDERFIGRAEIIREKGTNRSAFFRGEIDKYGWVDIGSSFLPADIIAAFLYAQLQNIDDIQRKRKQLWQYYFDELTPLKEAGKIAMPFVPAYATNNAHMFYIICDSLDERQGLIAALKSEGILAVFHYLSLHTSKYYSDWYKGGELPRTDFYSERLLRLPLYYELAHSQLNSIIDTIYRFYNITRETPVTKADHGVRA